VSFKSQPQSANLIGATHSTHGNVNHRSGLVSESAFASTVSVLTGPGLSSASAQPTVSSSSAVSTTAAAEYAASLEQGSKGDYIQAFSQQPLKNPFQGILISLPTWVEVSISGYVVPDSGEHGASLMRCVALSVPTVIVVEEAVLIDAVVYPVNWPCNTLSASSGNTQKVPSSSLDLCATGSLSSDRCHHSVQASTA